MNNRDIELDNIRITSLIAHLILKLSQKKKKVFYVHDYQCLASLQ